MTAAGEAKFESKLITPNALGQHQLATLYIEYANTGKASMPAPLIQLRSGDADDSDKPLLTLKKHRLGEGYWTNVLPDGFSHSITILASSTPPPGVLNPGERIRVPVYYAGLLEPWNFNDDKVELAWLHTRQAI